MMPKACFSIWPRALISGGGTYLYAVYVLGNTCWTRSRLASSSTVVIDGCKELFLAYKLRLVLLNHHCAVVSWGLPP